ncbi:MAG: Rho termination factor N-terminal domain-containing protein, partial [Candidatus Riflebacteria bacterium]|nr:Rho termination factor N-terminal domain-containing protein [Candidatus Riflebacteria bacterium]
MESPNPTFTYLQLCDEPIKNLKAVAKAIGIDGLDKMKKGELIRSILQEQYAQDGLALSEGVLDIMPEGYGFLRTHSYVQNDDDVYVSPSQIKRYNLMSGDTVIAQVRLPKDDESYHSLLKIEAVNGVSLDRLRQRVNFEDGIPVFPTDRFRLETGEDDVSTRVFDLVCPIGKGQRGLIVAPPKAGKTVLLKQLANAITRNHPEVLMLILLIDERP